jgi:hypothetical protein
MTMATGKVSDIETKKVVVAAGDPPPDPSVLPPWMLLKVCSFFAMQTTVRAVITRNAAPPKVRHAQRQAIRVAMTSKHWYSALKSHQSFFSHICLRGLWRSATDQLLLSLTDKYEQVIRSCDLEGCHALTDRSLGRLAECPKLRTMVVSMCKFTPQASWPSHLEHLVLNDCPQLDTSALQLIVEHNPDLRSLSLVRVFVTGC